MTALFNYIWFLFLFTLPTRFGVSIIYTILRGINNDVRSGKYQNYYSPTGKDHPHYAPKDGVTNGNTETRRAR